MGSPNPPIGNQVRHILIIFSIFLFSLTIISCSSEDDSALKGGKVAASLSEADQLELPHISSLTINNSSAVTNQTSVSVQMAGSDAIGITGYIISNQSTVPDLNSYDWVSITSQTQYSVSKDLTVGPSDASYSFYGWMKDDAEGISATASSSIIFDSTAPSIASVIINSGDLTTTNTVVSLSIAATDSLSGITAYYASETSSAPSATATGWIDITKTNSLSSTVSFTLSSSGAEGSFSKTVYLWIKDAAGNISSSSSDSITLIVADTTAPTNPSISINSGASTTTSLSVTLSLSASDNVGVTGYYLSTSSSTPSSTASGWSTVTSSTSFSASDNYTLTILGLNTVYVWYKDAAGNVSSPASDTIIYSSSDTSIPNIYCGLSDSSTAGNTSLSATKLTSGTTRAATLSSSTNNYYFFFTATSSSTYTISWSGNAWEYSVYKGVGNRYYYSYNDDDSTSVSDFTGNVIIKFDPDNSGDQVSFSITGGTIIDYHTSKNSNCQVSIDGGTTSSSSTTLDTGKIYRTILNSWSNNYYYKFNATSNSEYSIVWSGNASGYTIYKGENNEFYSSNKDDDDTTITNYTGDVIVKFKPTASGDSVDFMINN